MQHRVEVIDRAHAALLAAKTPAERIAMAASAHRSARTMIRARLEQLFAGASPEKRQQEFLRRMLGMEMLGHGAD